jgi:DNA polymerase-1
MTNNKEKLLIIDGHNLLFQMFFGMPSRIINKDGQAIQGTLGFIGALIKIIKRMAPTHLVVLFDGEHENERTKLLADYKANRTDYSKMSDEENPFSQLNDIYKGIDYMGIKHAEIIEMETDDVIASYVRQYGQQMQIIISSFDSDFFQLISNNVSVLRYRGDNTVVCDREYIQNKFGIGPERYIDFKSLTGDGSDNIRGAEKVGAKTASLLINQFGSLENILLHAERISKTSIQKTIIANSTRLQNNYALIKLNDEQKIPYALGELRYEYSGISTNEVLCGIGLR